MSKSKTVSLTEGSILGSLMRFAVPIFLSLLLQALYGAVDLLVCGQFGTTADVSGVSTGSSLITTLTNVITGLAMGITVTVGEAIGRKNQEDAGKAVGTGLCLFAVFAVVLTVLVAGGAPVITNWLQAPEEAYAPTMHYIRICGAGSIFIVSYNVLGAIFRGIGDAKTPLMTVGIACVVNIFGDLLFVDGFGMGAAGAALATVGAQCISVIVSFVIIMRRRASLPFTLTRDMIRFNGWLLKKEIQLGAPVAIQEIFVGSSFIIIQAVVNKLGVTPSAGVGIAEKVCAFVMLVPSAYVQSMSAFVAQNMGAGKRDRANKGLKYSLATAFGVGLFMLVLLLFAGNVLAGIFTKDTDVILAAHSYLKAYAVDCLISPMMFCFIGYFNGRERTLFVMLQGFIGAYLVRLPIVIAMSHITGVTLFQIGLGTPASSLVQITLCILYYRYINKRSGV